MNRSTALEMRQLAHQQPALTESLTNDRNSGPPGRRKKIAFFGHFGRANFGNESTLQATLSYLQHEMPDAEFSCICTDPEVVAADYNITTVPSRRARVRLWSLESPLARWVRKLFVGIPSELYRWIKPVKTLWGTDVLVVPGTGLLNDSYTFFYWGPYDMFRWSIAAKLARCKLLFVSVGAGPLHSRAGRFFVKTALHLADFRSYRDHSTQQYLKSIGFPAAKDPVYPDLAFSLPAMHLPHGRDGNGRRTVVGIGLMEYGGTYSTETRPAAAHRAYLETLVEFATWLLAHNYDVRLLIGDLVDTAVTQEFRALLKERSVACEDGRIVDEPVASFKDVLSQIAATDFVVATRFHNILFSILLNKPTIAVSFHHKCSSLMSQMGLAEYCENINTLGSDRLIEKFVQLEKNAGGLKAMMAAKVKERQDALDEQYSIILSHICPGGAPIPGRAIGIQPKPKVRTL